MFFLQETYVDIVRTSNCTSVGLVVLLARHAIDRGSNPTVGDTVVKKIVETSLKVGATRVPFVRPFQTLNTNTRKPYIYIFCLEWSNKWHPCCTNFSGGIYDFFHHCVIDGGVRTPVDGMASQKYNHSDRSAVR